MRSFSVIALGAFMAISAVSAKVTSFNNTIYLIRHADGYGNGTYGLSAQGEQRAQCIKNLFGSSSDYDIGFIISQHPQKTGRYSRPDETVEPLAEELGLKVNKHCHKTDVKCAHQKIEHYMRHNSGNVLVVWDRIPLGEIGKSFGANFTYPSKTVNLIYEIQDGQLTPNSPFSENCLGMNTASSSSISSSATSTSASVSATVSASASSSVTSTSSSSATSSAFNPI